METIALISQKKDFLTLDGQCLCHINLIGFQNKAKVSQTKRQKSGSKSKNQTRLKDEFDSESQITNIAHNVAAKPLDMVRYPVNNANGLPYLIYCSRGRHLRASVFP